MAVTGTGSLSDPYLVGNYTDLNAVCKGHGTYWSLGSRVYVKLIDDIWGTGVDWDLSTHSERIMNQEQTDFYYNCGTFVLDMNGFSFVSPWVTNGLLFPVPKIYGYYPSGGAYLRHDYYNGQFSNMVIIKNGTVVDLTVPDATDNIVYAVWLINMQFLNCNITNHEITDARSHPSRIFAADCMIDRCVITGDMHCQHRGEITNAEKQAWFSECTMLHSDLRCNMINAGEYYRDGSNTETATPYKMGGDIGWSYKTGGWVNTQVWKTRMRGKISGTGDFYKFIDNVTQYNVIDLDMSDCTQSIGNNRRICANGRAGTASRNVCNTDNLPNMSTGTLGVTSAQITSGDALRLLGFPVTNVDIW